MNQYKQNAMMEEAIASAELSMDTPDTEVDKAFHEGYERGMKAANDIATMEIEKVRDERDTYWKERVEGMKRKLELEYVEGECVECAGTGEGADNPNSDSGETYPCYLCKGKGRFSGYTKKKVDTLLDNLK